MHECINMIPGVISMTPSIIFITIYINQVTIINCADLDIHGGA